MKVKFFNTTLEFGSFEFSNNALVQNLSITEGEASLSNAALKIEDLGYTSGKIVVFKLVCDSSVVDKFAVLTTGGKTIETERADNSIYEPNKLYVIENPNSQFFEGSKFGCYVFAAHALETGTGVFKIEVID